MRDRRRLTRIWADLRRGRHREAYAIFMIGLVLTPLGLAGVAAEQLLLSMIVLALTFLVFHTTVAPAAGAGSLEEVLRSRDRFQPLGELLRDAQQLWVYGPTAVNVIMHVADIRRHVLDRGGEVRVIVQDPEGPAADFARAQLDDNLDFQSALSNSLAALARMRRSGGDCEYRLLPFNPGFSLLVVNARKADGFLVLELHGFKDDSIAQRMHIRISRAESMHWFEYWTQRFTTMWQAAKEPRPSMEENQ